MLHLTVDGHERAAPEGTSLLAALHRAGYDVPSLCHDERFAPQGACRLCMVEVAGRPGPVPACTTPVSDGMEVVTTSPRLDGLRRTVLALHAEGYPGAAVRAAPDLPFHRLLLDHDLVDLGDPPAAEVDVAHPFIDVDLGRCIDCFRCVRICEDVQGQDVWRVVGRGASTQVVPGTKGSLALSDCVSCGACVDTCPTGALADRGAGDGLPATHWTRSTCGYCGVGCELVVGTRDGRVVAVRPAHDAPANRGHLCVKGRYGFGFNASPDRLTTPLVRGDDGVLHPASWPEAVEAVARRLERVLAEHGPRAVGVLASARATNEANYVTQKFARAVLGTNNVDCCARVCHAPSAAALGEMLGTGAATSSYDDIERARTIVVCGSNATENHPVVGARIRQAARAGAHLIVVDPRTTELAAAADVHLRTRPGTDVALLDALAAVVVQEGLVDSGFLHRRVEGVDGYLDWARPLHPEVLAAAAGVDAGDVRRAARTIAMERPTLFVHGLGLTEHHQGTDAVRGVVNLALLTGNIGRPGAGVNPLRGQNNVQGAAHMGCEPAHLTGFAPVADAAGRFGAEWGADVPQRPGLDAVEMIAAAGRGELRALWTVGWDIAHTQPSPTAVRQALSSLDLLVVQDIFLNETARDLAHVVLPVASTFEEDGTYMSSERRVQRVRRAVDPPGEARPDWSVFPPVAAALGYGHLLPFRSAEEVWEEIRRVWPAGRGITAARLDRPGGAQWPSPDEDHPGTTILHRDTFARPGGRALLRVVEPVAAAEQPDDDHPFVLVTGRGLYQFNSATMTRRTPLAGVRPTDTLEVCAADAGRLGVAEGDPVRVDSRHGSAVLPAEITSRVPPGVVFATFSDPVVAVNDVVGPELDPVTHTPAYKVTAVALAPAPSVRPSPPGSSGRSGDDLRAVDDDAPARTGPGPGAAPAATSS